MPARRGYKTDHGFRQISSSRLRHAYGDNIAAGCRNMAELETDEDEKTFWLKLADEWERRQRADQR